MRVFLAFLATTIISSITEAGEYWDYKDWIVLVEELDTGQDLRRTCTAWTGGDGQPTLRLEITNGDAGPPDAYPLPTLEERAPRGYATQIRAEDSVIYEFDDGTGADMSLTTGFEEGVFEYALAAPWARDSLWMLQSMRTAQTMIIYRRGLQSSGREHVTTVSLSGFTAAYLKMMSRCGHEPGAVMN
ncbi:hypothetical protein [uncultured Roseobacter sp.]|uniref:hypothetical protein n=1 Tax=uncultured Roseobacter sp. TaxID=114847 RepID=UPI00261E98E3|nr:hypothetical protein [uncultured Roseobacter sp.]